MDDRRPRGRVERDGWGVPHVVAASLPELLHEQGRDAAVDRRWQLTWSRLRAAGSTAAVVGRRGLAWDAFARRCDVESVGRRAFEALEPETRALLTAYVEGVRAGLAEAAPCRELDELGDVPDLPWEPSTPLAVFHAHHLLFATFPRKLWDEHVRRTVGPDLARVFRHEGPDLDELTGGSNAWAVGGDLTASGLPLVAGDPHRSFESPNGYQQVRLTCTDPDDPVDVAGFTFPGVPGVQHFAHAGDVAWGITNAVADYQDLYLERLRRRDGRVEALGPAGWYDVPAHVERVAVRHDDGRLVEEEVEVVRTANGPVVHGGTDSPDGPDDRPIALRHSTHVMGHLGFDAVPRLLRARTAADVEAAFAGWVEPVNNLVVADVHGDVRFRVVGAVPRRHPDNRHGPVPGWLAEHAWTGWEDDLPAHPVAPDEVVVTANDRKSEDYDKVGPQFGTPVRAERIRALLAGRRGLTVEDMAAVHRDVLAGQPAPLHRALQALDGLEGDAERLRVDVAAWDQHFHADSTAATAYVRIRTALVQRLADQPALAPLREHPWGPLVAAWCDLPTELWLSLPGVLSPGGRRLLATAGVDVDALLRAAVDDAAAEPAGSWGAHHVFFPTHALGRRLPPPYDAVGLPGDNDCVRCTGAPPGVDLALRGSVARYAWDLAGLERSGWVVPLGAAGDPSSPHHHDQLATWADGRLLPPA